MKFSKDELIDQAHKTIYDKLIDTSRWSIHYERVFEHSGKFYKTRYSRGATESQDLRPYEYEPDEIECPEVVPVEVTTIEYQEV